MSIVPVVDFGASGTGLPTDHESHEQCSETPLVQRRESLSATRPMLPNLPVSSIRELPVRIAVTLDPALQFYAVA